jgi:hypothetical protein
MKPPVWEFARESRVEAERTLKGLRDRKGPRIKMEIT